METLATPGRPYRDVRRQSRNSRASLPDKLSFGPEIIEDTLQEFIQSQEDLNNMEDDLDHGPSSNLSDTDLEESVSSVNPNDPHVSMEYINGAKRNRLITKFNYYNSRYSSLADSDVVNCVEEPSNNDIGLNTQDFTLQLDLESLIPTGYALTPKAKQMLKHTLAETGAWLIEESISSQNQAFNSAPKVIKSSHLLSSLELLVGYEQEEEKHRKEDTSNILQESSEHAKRMKSLFGIVDRSIKEFVKLASDPLSDRWVPMDMGYNNIKCHKLQNSESIYCVRAVGYVRGPPRVVKETILDWNQYMLWDPLLQSAQIVEELDRNTRISHLIYRAKRCFIEQTRDFVIIQHSYQKSDGGFVIVSRSVNHKAVPLTKGTVRGTVLPSGSMLNPHPTNPNITKVIYIAHVDLSSEMLPLSLVSLVFDKVQPLYTIRLDKYVYNTVMARKGISSSDSIPEAALSAGTG